MSTSNVWVEPWSPRDADQTAYDLFVTALGFEARARYIAERVIITATVRVASAFDSRKTHAFAENERWFRQARFTVLEVSDSDFATHCRDVVSNLPDRLSHVCMDVSSMSRFRLASWVAEFRRRAAVQPLLVDFLYAPAHFSEPLPEGVPIVISEPVVPAFAGWSVEPQAPTVAILGLGYEADKAVGTLEYLEPSAVWAFIPYGEDPRYETALEKANYTLWDLIPKERVVRYRVDNPFSCFTTLEAVTFGSLRSHRPVLIPFGPKIFVLLCLLVACRHAPNVVVWRVSAGQHEPAQNRSANGKVVGIRAHFQSLPG